MKDIDGEIDLVNRDPNNLNSHLGVCSKMQKALTTSVWSVIQRTSILSKIGSTSPALIQFPFILIFFFGSFSPPFLTEMQSIRHKIPISYPQLPERLCTVHRTEIQNGIQGIASFNKALGGGGLKLNQHAQENRSALRS